MSKTAPASIRQRVVEIRSRWTWATESIAPVAPRTTAAKPPLDPSATLAESRHADGGRAERRALDDQEGVRSERHPRDVLDLPAGGVDVVPVERAIGLRVERPQAVRAGQLQVTEATLRVGLEQQRVADARSARDDLAPAAAAAPLGDRPGDRGTVIERAPAGDAQRGGHRSVPTALASRRSSAQRAATASSSPASDGATRPTDPDVALAVLELDRATLADAGQQLARPRTARRRRRRPTCDASRAAMLGPQRVHAVAGQRRHEHRARR